MTTREREVSPQRYARVGGMLYLFIIVAALFGEIFVRGKLIARGVRERVADHLEVRSHSPS